MSRTGLHQNVILQVWVRAGGRCEYPGCNRLLWRDDLTQREMNRAYLAHIVADSPNGPRGHQSLSEQLKADAANIMLLCDTHHRLIDREDVTGHPAELLFRYKKEHEERIERQTAIQTNRRTQIILFGTRIGDRQGDVNYEQACEAVLAEERYPADDRGIRLDLAGNEVSDADPDFWDRTTQYIQRHLARYLVDGVGPNGLPLNHLSIFALAPIPALIAFGKQVGDIVSAEVYERHRSHGDWRWRALEDERFDYIVERPDERRVSTAQIAVNLSLSGLVQRTEIERAMGGEILIYSMKIAEPRRGFLHAKEQLELFRNEWARVLSEIRAVFGEECEIHLFPAIPPSVAVEIGRALLPKSDPHIVVYDNDRARGGFRPALVV